VFLQPAFADGYGWNQPQYYRTIRYVDADGDGDTDICARGDQGILCSAWRRTPNSHFDPAVLMTGQFRDGYGWGDARYFTSIRFGDLSGDGPPEICGRGGGGLYCGVNRSTAYFLRPLNGDEYVLVQTDMNDGQGWGQPANLLDSLFIVDFDKDGKNDVCGLNAPNGGYPDLFCAKSRSTSASAAFDPLVTRTRNVNTSDRIVAGHLYTNGGIGFCWRLVDGSVNCSAPWN